MSFGQGLDMAIALTMTWEGRRKLASLPWALDDLVLALTPGSGTVFITAVTFWEVSPQTSCDITHHILASVQTWMTTCVASEHHAGRRQWKH